MLPDLIIIGAMKAATTSLHRYLDLHPEISMSAEKEVNFFDKEANFQRGLAWYEQHFEEQHGVRIYGEASTNYTKYPTFSGVPQRIHSLIPQVKLIYILRDPIERALSHYFMYYARNRAPRMLEDVVESSPYIRNSRYHLQLQQYLPFFPLEQIHILTSEALQENPRAAMQQVFQFLGVDATFDSMQFQTRYNSSADIKGQNMIGNLLRRYLLNKKSPLRNVIIPLVPQKLRHGLRKALFRTTAKDIEKPLISAETRQRFCEYFQSDVDALRKLTGMIFSEWSL